MVCSNECWWKICNAFILLQRFLVDGNSTFSTRHHRKLIERKPSLRLHGSYVCGKKGMSPHIFVTPSLSTVTRVGPNRTTVLWERSHRCRRANARGFLTFSCVRVCPNSCMWLQKFAQVTSIVVHPRDTTFYALIIAGRDDFGWSVAKRFCKATSVDMH